MLECPFTINQIFEHWERGAFFFVGVWRRRRQTPTLKLVTIQVSFKHFRRFNRLCYEVQSTKKYPDMSQPMNQSYNPEFSLDDLYEAFELKLRRYAGSLVHDPHRADDLVQETFIRALAPLPLLARLEKNQRLAWLRQVLKNRFIDTQRAYQREQEMVDQLIREARAAYQDQIPISSQELLDLVSDNERELLFQRYVLGMTSVEIGLRLGIPAATVRSRLYLAKKRLRPHRSDFI